MVCRECYKRKLTVIFWSDWNDWLIDWLMDWMNELIDWSIDRKIWRIYFWDGEKFKTLCNYFWASLLFESFRGTKGCNFTAKLQKWVAKLLILNHLMFVKYFALEVWSLLKLPKKIFFEIPAWRKVIYK